MIMAMISANKILMRPCCLFIPVLKVNQKETIPKITNIDQDIFWLIQKLISREKIIPHRVMNKDIFINKNF